MLLCPIHRVSWSSIFAVAGDLGKISNLPQETESADAEVDDIKESSLKQRPRQGFYVEHSVFKEICINNSMSVSVSHCSEKAKNVVRIETDLPGDVVAHWGVWRDEGKNWEVPVEPYPPETINFKNKALQTRLQVY